MILAVTPLFQSRGGRLRTSVGKLGSMEKSYILGIDTGGTHTDAVIFDQTLKNVVACAKAPTTHHDLSLGISAVLKELGGLKWKGGRVERIHLSTTLATNAIAEDLRGRVGLIMIGYDQDHQDVRSVVSELKQAETAFVAGGHNYYGQEECPLDEAAVSAAVERLAPRVSGWAISGLFSVKNPGHELRAAQLVKEISSKPVTLGRDLTGELNAVRRAATAALNAGLIVIIGRLLDAVKKSAREAGLEAALMVVKGDGSLVSEAWAREKPIETVVSGPAASLVGARVLAGGFLSPEEKNLWVLDVGGTTTDMALLKEGLPAVNPNGARIGKWNTMTVAVEARTSALGGDSLTALNQDGRIGLGPRRVLPLCRLAAQYPEVLNTLKQQRHLKIPASQAGCFFLPGLPPEPGLGQCERQIISAMETKCPLPLASFCEMTAGSGIRFAGLESLRHPSILVSAFTPTDAMSVLGLYKGEGLEASILGAEILGKHQRLSAQEVSRRVLDEFGRLLAQEIISYGFAAAGLEIVPAEYSEQGLLGAALGRRPQCNIEISVRSTDTVILLGAPVNVLMPFLAKYLQGRILVPPSFDAASAVGAACSPVYLNRKVEIHAMPGLAGYRLFLPDEIIDGETVDELVQVAEEKMTAHMTDLAILAGASKMAIKMSRDDRRVGLGESEELNLGTILTFTAKGSQAA